MATQSLTRSAQSQQLAKMEHKPFYASSQATIATLELATATSFVLVRRFGQQFADELCAEL